MSGKVMDKTQMESTLKMLQTAVTNQQPSEQIIDVLEQLKAVHVTEDLIRVCSPLHSIALYCASKRLIRL